MILCLPGVHLHAGSAWLSSSDPNYALLRQPGTTLAGWLWPIAFGFSKHTHISSMLVLVPFCPQLPWDMLLYLSTFIHHGTFLHFMAVKTGIWLFFLYQYLPSNDERYHFMCLYDSFCSLDIPIVSIDMIDHRDDKRDWRCTWYARLGKLTYW